MQVGMVGLGRMGGNMAARLIAGGHRVAGFDPGPEAVRALVDQGGQGAVSLEELVDMLDQPRVVWLMIPAGRPVDDAVTELLPLLDAGDAIVDGGNSLYKDTLRRARTVSARGVHYVDVGTSGGVWGKAEGYSLMIGGLEEPIRRLQPIFETLAPAPDKGWGRVGPSGAGHFVKMVHNGIEYGLMQAYAEGFSILGHKTEFALDLPAVAEIWRYGSVVRSWLLDLTARALADNPTLEGIAPWVSDSGEGRWTLFEAVNLDVPTPVIAQALIQRLRSRDEESFADRLLAAMRGQFGGHAIKKEE
jgi:6-phosphogluconate dehydrogenase